MATAPKPVPKIVPAAEGAGAAPAPKRPNLMLVIIIVLLLVIIAGGGGAAWYMLTHPQSLSTHAPQSKPVELKPPAFLPLEQFTVNLQPEAGEQYLQVSLTLEMPDAQQAELTKTYMPVVRSRLLMLLSSKKASELSTPEGKKKLQEEIIAAIKQPFRPQMSPAEVSGVSFTAFVIQ